MRLRRLDLTRYGKFTGHSLDFGVRKPGAMTITSSMRGGFLDNPMTRNELMSLVFGK